MTGLGFHMDIKFKPPWLLYDFGWLSAGWKSGSAEREMNEFISWYKKLSRIEQLEVQGEYPESKWWSKFYFYFENVTENGPGLINPIEFMKQLKLSQSEYAETLYNKGRKLELTGGFQDAYNLYSEILRNVGDVFDSAERAESILANNDINKI